MEGQQNNEEEREVKKVDKKQQKAEANLMVNILIVQLSNVVRKIQALSKEELYSFIKENERKNKVISNDYDMPASTTQF